MQTLMRQSRCTVSLMLTWNLGRDVDQTAHPRGDGQIARRPTLLIRGQTVKGQHEHAAKYLRIGLIEQLRGCMARHTRSRRRVFRVAVDDAAHGERGSEAQVPTQRDLDARIVLVLERANREESNRKKGQSMLLCEATVLMIVCALTFFCSA